MIHLLRINRKLGAISFKPSLRTKAEVEKFLSKKQVGKLPQLLAVMYGGPESMMEGDQIVARRYKDNVTLFRLAPIRDFGGTVTISNYFYARHVPSYLMELSGGYDGYSTRNTYQIDLIMNTYKAHAKDFAVNLDIAEQIAKMKAYTDGLEEEIAF